MASFLVETLPGGGILLRKVFEIIKELNPLMVLRVSQEKGITAQIMDASQVSLADMCLARSMFKTFECQGDLSGLGLDVGRLVRVLKFADTEDSVILKHRHMDNHITVEIISKDSKTKCEFTSGMVFAESYEVESTILPTTVCLRLSSSELARICKDLSAFGDNMTFHFFDASLRLSTRNHHGQATVELPSVREGPETNPDTVLRASYAVRYLNSILKGSGIDSTVLLYLDNDRPLGLRFKLDQDSHLNFFLAPKIDDTDSSE